MKGKKAIILAGGEGSRLRPLSLLRPKPMLQLFDKPLLEHQLLLLKKHGFTDICMTLQYLPQRIRDWFGDGSDWDVSIRYRVERTPLGTAGSVGACRDFTRGEEVLILSGDAVCDADLSAFLRFHRERAGLATLLVSRCPDPLEYGLVLTDRDGRIRGFIEKPGTDRLYTDLVNTGAYLLSPEAMDRIPQEGSWDFGHDLFPALLAEGRSLYAWETPGYWNDVGTPEACLRTHFDVLDGRAELEIGDGRRDGRVIPPCWISPRASVDPGARLGPYAVIGAGSSVGPGCRVDHSVLDGAAVSAGCRVTGSILASGVYLGENCEVREGCVLADGVSAGAGSFIQSGVRIWPGKVLPEGSTVTASVAGDRLPLRLRFDRDGRLRAGAGTVLTPEVMLRMGGVSAPLRRCGAASDGGAYGELLAAAFLSGSGAAGREAFRLDAPDPAASAWAAAQYGLELMLHVRQEGERITLYCFDRSGMPISRRRQRELEAADTAPVQAALPGDCAGIRELLGTEEAHIAAAVSGCSPLQGFRAAVTGGRSLTRALRMRQAELTPPGEGVPSFRLSGDGLRLEAVDELGRSWTWDKLICALLRCELRGGQGPLCLPYAAPEAAETIAREEGGTLLRLGRDGDAAAELWRQKPYARDGLFLALRLCSWLSSAASPFRGRLAELMDSLPAYETRESLVEVSSGSGRLLRALEEEYGGETVSGLKLRTPRGCATVSADTLNRIRVLAESTAMEAAGELCDELVHRLRQLDD